MARGFTIAVIKMLSQKEEYFDISFVISGSLDWMSLSVPRQVLERSLFSREVEEMMGRSRDQ